MIRHCIVKLSSVLLYIDNLLINMDCIFCRSSDLSFIFLFFTRLSYIFTLHQINCVACEYEFFVLVICFSICCHLVPLNSLYINITVAISKIQGK